jgi:HlyD family secretion protein
MSIALTRKRLLAVGALLAVVLLIFWLTRPSPEEVETARAAYGALLVTVEEDGRTRALDRYVITAPVAGRLERLEQREGQRIEARQVIARIQPLPLDASTRGQLQARLRAAEANRRGADAALSQARAAAEQATRSHERRQRLYAEGAIAAENLEQYALAARTRTEELHAAAELARAAAAEVEAVRATLVSVQGGGAIDVRAPAAGLVLRVPERSGRVVGQGEPLLEVGDASALEVVVDVLSADAVRIRAGMEAVLRAWGGADLAARVRTIEPSAFTRLSALGIEEQRVNVILDLQDCPPGLGDGYRVEASILVASFDSVLTVPSSALFRRGEEWQLFVIDAGRVRTRTVTVGEHGGALTQITSGIAADDVVVLFPSDRLVDGTRVRARNVAGSDD